MSEKVKVSKEVAEAIDRLKDRNPTWTIHDIFHVVVNKGHEASKQNFEDVAILRKWAFTYELLFANALLIGYEVEQTPEDKVREYYKGLEETARAKIIDSSNMVRSSETHEMVGIIQTLNLLNIKIDGVNA